MKESVSWRRQGGEVWHSDARGRAFKDGRRWPEGPMATWRVMLVGLAMLGCRREEARPTAEPPSSVADPMPSSIVPEIEGPGDAPDAPAPAPESARTEREDPPLARPGPDPDTIVRWEDEEGGVHFEPWYRVPQRHRRSAQPVTAQVGRVTVDPPRARPLDEGRRIEPVARLSSPRPLPPLGPSRTGPKLNGLTDSEREWERLRQENMARMLEESKWTGPDPRENHIERTRRLGEAAQRTGWGSLPGRR